MEKKIRYCRNLYILILKLFILFNKIKATSKGIKGDFKGDGTFNFKNNKSSFNSFKAFTLRISKRRSINSR